VYDPKHITGTGNVGPDSGGTVHSIVLTAGDSAAATLTLKQGGSGGGAIFVIGAPQDGTTTITGLCAVYHGQLHATLGGTGATATIVI